jgi:hypothetical protein
MLPPSVFVGKWVNFMGRFQTYNAGSQFRVVDALPLTGKYRQTMRPVLEYLYANAEDPRDWLEKESMDHLLIRDV